jgi:cytoskeleton protein RodZ
MLADARMAKGLSVAEVGEKLKLTPRQIEALEAEDVSALPAAVFVRGFARNYARLLGLPADNLPGISEPATEPSAAITAPSEDLVFRSSSVRRWLLLPIAGLLLFMALVAALYSWLRQGEDAYLTSEVQSPVVSAPLPSPQALPVQPAPVQAVQPPAAAAAQATPMPPQSPVQPTVVPPVDNAAAGAALVTPPAPVKLQPAAQGTNESDAAPGAGHAVHLTAQDEDAWIEIVSADQKHTSRLLHAGEQMTVRGVPPLKLVVGNAVHVNLSYDEKPVDLHPYIGAKVARLTLE